MKIYLLGAEQPTNLRLALEGGAKHVGMSYHSLRKRLPKKKDYDWSKFGAAEVFLASGGHTVKQDLRDYVTEYEEFVGEHADRLALVTEVDHPDVDTSDHRATLSTTLGDKFVPVWLEERGISELQYLAQAYETVGLRAETVRTSPILAAQLAPLRRKYGTNWFVLDGARPDDLMTGRFQAAATIGWLSPMRNGETIVWDGVRMQRYPKRMADVARRRHLTAFNRAGFDGSKILEGDYQETTRYTVYAYACLEEALDRKKPSTNPFRIVQENVVDHIDGLINNEDMELEPNEPGSALSTVDKSALEVRNTASAPIKRDGPRQVMPGFGFDLTSEVEIGEAGERVVVERLLAKKGSEPLRQCDTCHVAANCPAFQPQAECAYSLPIEIKTKAQLSAALAAIVEKQFDRVAFMMMQEELNGGYADPNTSSEIERLMKIIKDFKDIEDNTQHIRFQMEAKASAGVLQRLFGESATKPLGQLDHPILGAEIERRALEP